MIIRFVDISLKKGIDFKGIHVPTDFLLKAAKGIVDFKLIAIEQLRERGLDENGKRIWHNIPFTKSELSTIIEYVENNSACIGDDLIEILNESLIPNEFIRERLGYFVQFVMDEKNKGIKNDLIKLEISTKVNGFLDKF